MESHNAAISTRWTASSAKARLEKCSASVSTGTARLCGSWRKASLRAFIRQIAEILNRFSIRSIGLGERAGDRRVEEWVSRLGLVHADRNLDEIVGLDRFSRR